MSNAPLSGTSQSPPGPDPAEDQPPAALGEGKARPSDHGHRMDAELVVLSNLGWANHQVVLSLGFWNHVSEILVRICSLETEEIKNHEQGGSHTGLCGQRSRANQ